VLFVPQLVPAVTELMVAELLYLEKQGQSLPIEMLINSSGTTRQDGEIVSDSSTGPRHAANPCASLPQFAAAHVWLVVSPQQQRQHQAVDGHSKQHRTYINTDLLGIWQKLLQIPAPNAP
jgi:hypothetical protein